LNDIACNLNSIQFKFLNLVQIHGMEFELIWDSIEFRFDWIHMQFNLNSIENKWDANWCKRYWKSIYDYGVEKTSLKKHISKKTPFHSLSFENQLNIFKFGILVQRMIYGI